MAALSDGGLALFCTVAARPWGPGNDHDWPEPDVHHCLPHRLVALNHKEWCALSSSVFRALVRGMKALCDRGG